MDTDPFTGSPLPPTAIQRILFVSPKVHVYQIPPLTSTKGYVAASWTADDNKRCIFTARVRILEIAIPNDIKKSASPVPLSPAARSPAPLRGSVPSQRGPQPVTNNARGQGTSEDAEPGETVSVVILLEDPSNGALFAAAPYDQPSAVQQAIDSSRFFALRVSDPSGRKAMLGIGFEERSEAFDFSVSLQDARKTLKMDNDPINAAGGTSKANGKVQNEEVKRDFRLKEGETITVKIGGKGGEGGKKPAFTGGAKESDEKALFSIAPPPPSPGSASLPFLPPPPSARDVKAERRRSRQTPLSPVLPVEVHKKEDTTVRNLSQSIKDLGFDDGEFGEFQ